MEKITLLLVEDSIDDAKLLRLLLREFHGAQFEIVHVSYLRDALERLKSSDIEAILLDLSLPDSQGAITFQRIYEAARTIPILVLTGYDDETTAVNTVREGAQDYVVKGKSDGDLLGRAICYAIERKKSEERLRAALREREVLLQEVHHRVRNNLQVICSLLSQQARKIPDKAAQFVFNESRNRILSMALVHEELYRSKDFSQINFDRYLASVARSLADFYAVDREKVRIKIDAESFPVQLEIAVPCGLIVNELLSNAFKHGISASRGEPEVHIRLERRDDQHARICVRDTGPGLPEHMNIHGPNLAGFELITLLLRQINGTISYSKEPFSEFIVDFPVEGSHLNRRVRELANSNI
jgi:two-component sensor histidine kinase